MKTSTLLICGIAAVSLSACGGTTGVVAKNLAKNAAMSSAATQLVTPTSVPTSAAMQVQVVDNNMDCEALTKEMAAVDETIRVSNKTLASTGGATFAGQAAAAGASQAALHSGGARALAKVPFGGLFAKTAMDAAANAGRKKAERAQADLQNANLRKASLSGLYAGKNCAS